MSRLLLRVFYWISVALYWWRWRWCWWPRNTNLKSRVRLQTAGDQSGQVRVSPDIDCVMSRNVCCRLHWFVDPSDGDNDMEWPAPDCLDTLRLWPARDKPEPGPGQWVNLRVDDREGMWPLLLIGVKTWNISIVITNNGLWIFFPLYIELLLILSVIKRIVFLMARPVWCGEKGGVRV